MYRSIDFSTRPAAVSSTKQGVSVDRALFLMGLSMKCGGFMDGNLDGDFSTRPVASLEMTIFNHFENGNILEFDINQHVTEHICV